MQKVSYSVNKNGDVRIGEFRKHYNLRGTIVK